MLTKLTNNKKTKKEIRDRIANLPCNAECTVLCGGINPTYYSIRNSADYYYGG